MNLDSLVLSDRMHDKSDLERQFSGWRHDQSLNVVGCCINALKGCDRESSGFTCTGLRLSDCIVSLNNWKDTFTLDRGGLVKTISINASQSFLLQSHIIKPINWFIPIGFQVLIIYTISDIRVDFNLDLPASSSSGVLSTSVLFSSGIFWVLYET